MRIKFGDRIYEVTKATYPGNTGRYVYISCSNGCYAIDCEEPNYASWLMTELLRKGYFDASGVDYTKMDYNYDESHKKWFKYCNNKIEEQKVFGKWINGGR